VADNGTLLVSTDAVSWTVRSTGLTNIAAGPIIYGNGTFVALGTGSGEVLTSPDAQNWSVRNSKAIRPLSALGFGNGIFVGISSQFCQISTNGSDWSTPVPTSALLYASGLACGPGTFIAVGRFGTILTSSDGIQWQPRNSNTTLSLNAAAYGNGSFVSV